MPWLKESLVLLLPDSHSYCDKTIEMYSIKTITYSNPNKASVDRRTLMEASAAA